MFGIGKYAKSWFYIEYLICTNGLSLRIKGFQFFRNCIWENTYNKSFGLGSTALNEVCKHIGYILDYISFFFYQSDLRIEALTGHKNMTR